MNSLVRYGALAAVAALLIGNFPPVAEAKPIDTKPILVGIGFDDVKKKARRRAIAAWAEVAQRMFPPPFRQFILAQERQIVCAQNTGLREVLSDGFAATKGDVFNAHWLCKATGRPSRMLESNLVLSIGIGFGGSDRIARGYAIQAWTDAVRDRNGASVAQFKKATDTSVRCSKTRSRPIRWENDAVGMKGSSLADWTCIAIGLPVRS